MRGRRLLLEKLLPRAPSRRAAGNKLVFSFRLVRPCDVGAFSCFGVMVTAADRAAATCLRKERTCVPLFGNSPNSPSAENLVMRGPRLTEDPSPHVRGGSVSRRGLTQLHRRAPPLRRNQPRRNIPLKRQPLFGREGSGGRGASLREAASPPSRSPSPGISPKTNIARGEPRATF